MTHMNSFSFCASSCSGMASAASFDARITNIMMDTVAAQMVSICIIVLAVAVRLHGCS